MEPLRLGLITPIVSLLPGTPEWEVSATVDDLRAIAATADRLGFAYLTCSEHVGVPSEVAKLRGPRFYDPLATLSFLAALTERIRLLTHVVVLPYHHPLAVAKRYGTLDRLSDGRLILGVGIGTLKEEFDLLGAPFDGRGARYEESLRALRIALGHRQPSFDGTFVRFDDFVIDPCAVQSELPIWLGGRTAKSLKRAVTFGDGWVPFGLKREELHALLAEARELPEWRARTRPFEVALACTVDESPADAVAEELAQTCAAGATILSLTVRARSQQHYRERLEWLAREVAPLI
jgi:probable F420-dependent oxidoreductase